MSLRTARIILGVLALLFYLAGFYLFWNRWQREEMYYWNCVGAFVWVFLATHLVIRLFRVCGKKSNGPV
jgi:hypothetical protein